jgi:hypothetical protein
MARKRASLKDKGEEILGVKRGGQGADILFGAGTEAEAAAKPESDKAAAADASSTQGGPPEGKAGRDKSSSAKAGKGKVASPPVAEHAPAMEGLPQGEADLDEESDLDSFLSAEAQAAAGEAALPDLATTPAAPAPPVSEPASPPPSPPSVERPLPAPPPSTSPAYPQGGAASTAPPAMERPKPIPPPQTPVSPPGGPAGMPPPVATPARLPPTTVPPPPTLAVAPPSTATGAPDLSVQRPPRFIQMVGEGFDLSAEEPSADAAAAAQVGAPAGLQLTPEERDELLRRRSVQEKLVELDKAIDGQYERILQDNVSANKAITDWCQNILAEARGIVLNREVDKLARAEWDVEQVRARVDRAVESQKQANRFAWLITLWGVGWFVIFVYLIFNPTFILQLLAVGASSDALLVPQIFLRSLFFGGIGGVAAVFYHLFKYVRERTFDSQYILSYAGKPFMGMILGSMIYLTVFVLMRVVGLAPVGVQGSEVNPTTEVMYTALLFFIAMAAGFKENLAFDLLNRMIKAVLGSEGEEVSTPPPPPPATTPTNP